MLTPDTPAATNWTERYSMAGPTMQCASDSESSSSTNSPSTTTLSRGEEGEEKICAVCGDRATGYHFHVMTCEGCKGFFRRSVIKGTQFTCPFTSSCPITKTKRRQCQACRFQKCLTMGMKKDMVMSSEALRLRRALRHQKRQQEQSPKAESAPCPSLTAEQEQLIEILTEAHQKNFDSSFSQFSHYQWPLSSDDYPDSYPEEVLPDVFSMLPIFADMSTFMIKQVIQFAKAIPAFRSLPIDDQISLLKWATLEICQIRFNTVFNEETKAWECGPHCYTIQDGALAGFQQIYLEPLLKFHISLRKLKLHDAEYVLLQALVLFSPDQVNVIQREEIDQTQEKIALTLKSYTDQRHPLPEGRCLYAKLLLLLTELRTLKVENTRQILHIQDLSTMTPLLSEIVS